MFCPNCGKYTEDGSLFCGECGTSLKEYWPDMEPEAAESELGARVEDIMQETDGQTALLQEEAPQAAPENPYGGFQGQYYGDPQGMYYGGQQGQPYGSQQGQPYGGQQGQPYGGQQSQFYGGQQGQPYGGQQGQPYGGQQGQFYGGQQGQPYGGPQGQQPPIAPKKPLDKKIFIAIGEGVLAVALLVGAFQLMGSKLSAKAAAENYWEAVSNCDWAAVYDSCEFPDSELLSLQNFVNAHAQDNEPVNYKSVKFIDASEYTSNRYNEYSSLFGDYAGDADVEEGDQKVFYVEYTFKGDSNTHEETILVTRTGEKRFLFWDEWKVIPTNYVTTDFTFEVPNGASVSLNGVDIASQPGVKLEAEEGDYWAYIHVPYIFGGEYQMEVSMAGMEPYREIIDTTYSSYADSPRLVPAQETIDAMAQQAASDVQTVYTAMLNLQSFDSVQGLFSQAALADGYVAEDYAELIEYLSEYQMASMTMDNMTVSLNYISDTEIDYEVYFHYVEQYSVNGELRTDEGNDSVSCEYSYENGTWKLSELPG